jgi:glycine oxidase
VPLTASSPTDVLVVGAGLIGMSCAAAAAERGFSVRLIGEPRNGESSLAAAGMLAPSVERADGPADEFGIAARDRYPAYVDWLRERTGIAVPLNRAGIIQAAITEAGVRGLQRAMPTQAEWLDAKSLHALEPSLGHALGGVYHANDGATDNVLLHRALSAVVGSHAGIQISTSGVTSISFSPSVRVACNDGSTYSADRVVLATGAWASTITGLPRAIPVEPVRGQMISYARELVGRCIYGPTGYVVPRPDGRTLIGATTERVGFDPATTQDGIDKLKRTAAEILPMLAGLEPASAWAGLRPMSSDLHPILGVDPDEPRLFYATGHSRNGILMTPITGECTAALLTGEASPVDISVFSISRFSSPEQTSDTAN